MKANYNSIKGIPFNKDSIIFSVELNNNVDFTLDNGEELIFSDGLTLKYETKGDKIIITDVETNELKERISKLNIKCDELLLLVNEVFDEIDSIETENEFIYDNDLYELFNAIDDKIGKAARLFYKK